MDISDSLSTNSVELDETMGSMLSASNENETQDTETDPPENLAADVSNLTSQNIEVNEDENVIVTSNLSDTVENDILDNVTSYTETLSDQDINLIIMGKPSNSTDDSEVIISPSEKSNPSTSQIEENEELWLGENTRQLVKVDTDEDFEVIVKSLETAIVETERYDIETDITTSEEPVISNSENSLGLSIIETDGNSLLEDIPSDLLTSTVPPLPLQEISEDETVEISLEIPDSPVDIIQHRNIDTYEEFAAISEPTVESLDEQSNSLFEVLEPEIDLPVDDEPSLLEIQEATMPTDIPEEFVCKEIEEEIITTQEKSSVQEATLSDMSNIVAESSATIAQSSERVAETSEIVVKSPISVAESHTAVAELLAADTESPESIELITESPLPAVESSTTVTESFEESSAQFTDSPTTPIIIESSILVSESFEEIAEPTAAPIITESVTEPSIPVSETFEEIVEPTVAPIISESPMPVSVSFEVIAESPVEVIDSPVVPIITESVTESPIPVSESIEVIEETSAQVTDSPVASIIAESVTESSIPVSESFEVIEESSAQVTDSPAAAIIAESVTKSPILVSESFEELIEESSAQVTDSPAAVIIAESVTESPISVSESFDVIAESSAQVTDSPAGPIIAESVSESPIPVSESIEVIEETSAQVTDSPAGPIIAESVSESSTSVSEKYEVIAESSAQVTDSPAAPIIAESVSESSIPVSESFEVIAESSAQVTVSKTKTATKAAPIITESGTESSIPVSKSFEVIAESGTESPIPVLKSFEVIAESSAQVTVPIISESVSESFEVIAESSAQVTDLAATAIIAESVSESSIPESKSYEEITESSTVSKATAIITESGIESPVPVSKSESSAQVTDSTAVSIIAKSVSESSIPVAESFEVIAEPSAQVTDSTVVSIIAESGTESPIPVSKSFEVIAESSAQVTDSTAVLIIPESGIESQIPVSKSASIIAESVSESSIPVSESFEESAESSTQITDSTAVPIIAESVSESLISESESFEVIAESVTKSPIPDSELFDIIAESPAATTAAESLSPFAEASKIVPEVPKIIAKSPVLVTESSEQIELSPAPVADSLTVKTAVESSLTVKELSQTIAKLSGPVTEECELMIQSPALVTELSQIIAESSEPALVADSPIAATVIESGVPVAEAPLKVTDLSELITESSASPAILSDPILKSPTSVAEPRTLVAEHNEELPVPDAESPSQLGESPAPVTELPEFVAESSEPVAEPPMSVAESTAPVAKSTPITKSPAPETSSAVTEFPELIAKLPAPITKSSAPSLTPVAELTTPIIESPTPIAESSAPVVELPAPESPEQFVELSAPIEESLMEIHTNITTIQEEKETILSETKISEIEIKDNLEKIQISKTEIMNDSNKTKESDSTLDNENKFNKIEDNNKDNLILASESTSKIDEVTKSPKSKTITDNLNENICEVNITKDTNIEIIMEQLDCKTEDEEIKEIYLQGDITQEIQYVDDNNLMLNINKDTNVEISKDLSDIKNVVKEIKEKKLRDSISHSKDDQPDREDKIEEIDQTHIEENIQDLQVDMEEHLDSNIVENKIQELDIKDITRKLQTDEVYSAGISNKKEFIKSIGKEITDNIKKTEENSSEQTETFLECKSLSYKDTADLSMRDIKISATDKITKTSEAVAKIESQKVALSNKEEPLLKSDTSRSKSVKHSLEFDEKEQSPPKKIKLVREKFQSKTPKSEARNLPKNIENIDDQEKKQNPDSVEKDNNLGTQEIIITSQVKKTVTEDKETIEQILEKLEDPSEKNESKSPAKAQKLKLQRNYKLPQKSPKQEKIVTKIAKPIEIKSNIPGPTIKTVDKKMTFEKLTAGNKKISDNLQDKSQEKNKSVVETVQEFAIADNTLKNEIKSAEPVQEIEIEQSVKSSSELCMSNKIFDQEIIKSVDEVQMDTSSTVDMVNDEELRDIPEVDFSKDIEDATEDSKISVEISSNAVLKLVTIDEKIDLEEQKKIIVTDNKEVDTNKCEIEEQSKMEQEEQNLAVESIKNIEGTRVHEIEEDIIENFINTQDENKSSDILLTGDTSAAAIDEKTEEPSQIEESSDDGDLPEILATEEMPIVEPLKETAAAVETIVTTTEIKSIEMECTSIENKKLVENSEEKSIGHVPKIPEIEMSVEENTDTIVSTEEVTNKAKIEISTKVADTLEIKNIVSLKQTEDNFAKIQETEKMIEKKTEIDKEMITESIEETQVSIATQKLIEIMQKEDKEEMQDDMEKTKYVETTDEIDKAEPITKNESSLTISTEYPLLSSRLREKLEPKRQKLNDEVKITSVSLPKVSQECVNKKLQGELLITKEDVRTTATTSLLAQNPEITLTKELRSSVSDHSATMESATKIKITKRKLATPEPTVRSVTKPLSVQIDDVEGSNDQRSHSYGGSGQKEHENIPKLVIKSLHRSEGRSSPKITIKPIKPPEDIKSREESSHSPKITIKPIVKSDPLKITITKQKTDDTHSILKIYQPEDNQSEPHVPKLTIKPIPKNDDMQHSPRITIKAVKPSSMSPKITVKPIPSPNDYVHIHSPKGSAKSEESYPKVTIKPVLRPEETHKVSQLSPRQIKLKSMTFESTSGVTVEPVTSQKLDPEIQTSPLKISVKSFAKMEESLSPKLTIKPITKTCEIVQSEDGTSNPLKLTIKPILKPEETSYQSPKITIKPIVKPDEQEEPDKPERIILKIQKNNLPSPKERKESRKEPEVKIEAIPHDPEKCQKLDKIKLKLTKEGSHAQIIPSISTLTNDGSFSLKRSFGISDSGIAEKRSKSEFSGTEILHTSDISINIVEPNAKPCPKSISEEVTIMKIDKASGSRELVSEHQISQSKFKEMLMKIQQKPDITCTPHIEADNYSSSSDDVKIVEVIENDPLKDPLSLQDDSNSQDVMIVNEVINTNPFQNIKIINARTVEQSTPKKRGRPRKNPLEVKPEIKGEDCIEVRPKRTCRAPPGRTPFVVKERKPRGAGRARGSSRGRGASKSPQKSPKETKTTPRGKALKEAKALAKIEAARLAQEVVIDEITIEDSTNDTPTATPIPPAEDSPQKPEIKCPSPSPPLQMIEPEEKIINEEVKIINEEEKIINEEVNIINTEVKIINEEVKIISEEVKIINEEVKQPPPSAVYEEETRMSADNSSRAQTPARQVFTAPLPEGPEESQSSVQSTATTESSKTKKGRLEVIDPDSAVTTVEQIVEYSWANGGPYMLQEQIAQFLGVKSFKRKYPGLTRRPVEMQERDYIREKGLVHESMCDMGLTAVPSSEILDIMYSDFQEKYEEYRKCLRDKQAKEISNKQKAVSLATSQEKNKIDFKERAIRSAASWNLNFNKARKDGRKCCMDLQTFTINYPAGKIKVPQKTPVGHYPLALVPGQYTDYFKSYTPNDLNYLPLNTVRYGPVLPNQLCDPGQSDGSQSDSDSSSGSDSDSSDDSMSTEEEGAPQIVLKSVEVNLTQLITTPKSRVH